ncbi:tRNA (adenosine(37)-N6)-threonylcarbamoyltransferase complex dimerization subunit type 1 TsaB [Zhaonella formicivorans]|uniref:tRNA (adenosine(37)-N6)-threonylcarbamoyltransferase complex dimerization subunit type 1 TsaB n=1 Tax=Zhaonella formicivorans TaxID=2528593 RepID=UPI0010F0B5E8|nr:tRNA (adenosine(37)-N6)-threonylcarbamoyltransferase complex dimerization subunit type 1 TsaB [Zhaonella formicivorans]
MRVLGLDSATNVASVAVVEEDRLIAELTFNTKKNHSQRLMPMLSWMLEEAQITLDELDGLAVAVGPGSFTGLRIGLATIKALAHVKDKPVLPVPTLDGLAANLEGSAGLICPVLNARKNEVYAAIYRWDGVQNQRLSPYLAVAPELLIARLRDFNETVTFLGDAVPIYGDQLLRALPEAKVAAATNALCRAAQIARLGLKKLQSGQVGDYFTLEPLYIRASEAEVIWEKRNRENRR